MLKILIPILFLGGCVTPQHPEVKETPKKLVKATWYGIGDSPNSHTASGQRFNPHDPGKAAHKYFKFGSMLRITNPRNNKSNIVTINDRGPFVKGVEIDLTYGAAKSIGMSGTQNVYMEKIK